MKYFWPYRFDDASGDLWLKGQRVPLPPKATALLRLLLVEAGKAVPADRVLASVWQGTSVQPGSVKAVVHELRTAIGDSAVAPRFIRSEHSRGYTFIANVTDSPAPFGHDDEPTDPDFPLLPGRCAAFAGVLAGVDAAREGGTRVVLLEGERGAGKSRLCRAAVLEARGRGPLRTARVQAVTGLDDTERFGLLTEAIGQLARQYPRAGAAVPDVGVAAPSCADLSCRALLARLPALSVGAPCLIVLEDLQWADAETINAVRCLARSATPTGTCVVATFCREEGPRRAELGSLVDELAYETSSHLHRLEILSEADLRLYLDACFGARVTRRLVTPLFRATGGHPHALFIAIDSLRSLGVLTHAAQGWTVGDTSDVAALLATATADVWRYQLNHLDPSRRRLLEAAATIGLEFSVDDVAAVTGVNHRLVGLQLAREAERRTYLKRLEPGSRPSAAVFRFRFPVVADALLATMTVNDGIGLHMPDSGITAPSHWRLGRTASSSR
jgi:DNA-binding winged helix-turn-helix (wHTH) protein